MTLTERIIASVSGAPIPVSASDVAREIKAHPATVSGIMCRLAKQSRLSRTPAGTFGGSPCDCEGCRAHKPGTWVYE
jgi:hypothetical protein